MKKALDRRVRYNISQKFHNDFLDLMQEKRKTYIAKFKFGVLTDTLDSTGQILEEQQVADISKDSLMNVIKNFVGEIEQIPPIYSAIKINGKKLYEYARKGEAIEIKPRKVNINKLEIVSFNKEKQTAELLIECSKGTYIRSIANDIGEALNCYGHLIKLVRIKAGKFSLKDTKKLEELETIEEIKKNLIYPLEYLNFPKYELNEAEKEKVSHGMSIEINSSDGLITLIQNNELIAICNIENKKAKMLKVFI